MTGFNLPPGVNVNDIPGNRPEDEEEERFWDVLTEEFKKSEPVAWMQVLSAVEEDDHLIALVRLVRDLGYKAGYSDGRADAFLDADL